MANITNSKFKYNINILHRDAFASNVQYIHRKTSFTDYIKNLFVTLTRWNDLLFDAMISFHYNPVSLVYGTLYFI